MSNFHSLSIAGFPNPPLPMAPSLSTTEFSNSSRDELTSVPEVHPGTVCSHCYFSRFEFLVLPNEPFATSYYYRYSSESAPSQSISPLESLPRELIWRILDQVPECLREIRAVRFSRYYFLNETLKIASLFDC